jgi:phenylpyruvate tautomerase PptA (4-oxalocrotonate tautomerase family)
LKNRIGCIAELNRSLNMPITTIQVRTQYTPAQEVAIIEAVQTALIEGFKIPPEDRHVLLVPHAPHRFIVPAQLAQPERFTVVTIDAFPGRSVEAKRNLHRAIVTRLEPLGIPRDHVTVIVQDIALENWGIRGGQAACDVELGFSLDV